MYSIIGNKYFKFGVVAFLYTLFVIWLKNFWWLFGLGVIYDMYITHKVNWTFWKKRDKKNSVFIEWIDALIFAIIAVTLINIYLFQNYKIPTPSMEGTMLVGDHLYVSKLSYGPRVPNTPLAFPFTQNRLPIINTESYLTWIKLPYKRLKGFSNVERDDIVVFNFPAGDTVVLENSATSYYSIIRQFAHQQLLSDEYSGRVIKSESQYYSEARNYVRETYTIVNRPVDRRDNYIKRCVAIPGDTLLIVNGLVYINGKPQQNFAGLQYNYHVKTNGTPLNPRMLNKYNISREHLNINYNPDYIIPLTSKQVADLQKDIKDIVSIEKHIDRGYDPQIFPYIKEYGWNVDNYGPLWIPAKNQTVKIDLQNISVYRMIIENYESNSLNIQDSIIYINGQPASEYTFKMDYYFMMGDNRHRSADSRFWGFVPEDHIVGKPKLIWLSTDKEKRFPGRIRFNRLFKIVRSTE